MIYPPLVLFAIVFFELFVLLRIGKDARAIVTLSGESMRLLVTSGIGDGETEAFIRRKSAEIFKATCTFAVKLLAIGLVIYLLFLLTVTLFPDLREAILTGLVSPAVIMIVTGATVCYALVRNSTLVKH